MTQTTLYDKISDLETQLQELKLEAYFSLPEKKRTGGRYSETTLLDAVKKTRRNMWNKRYTKKIARVR